MEARNLCDFDDLRPAGGGRAGVRPRDSRAVPVALPGGSRSTSTQDVDEQQVRLLKQLAAPDANLCAIGDPDQAIYGFRGADVRFFSEFRRDFPGTRVVRLARNYRSDRNIVALSAQVNPPLGPRAGPGVGRRRCARPSSPCTKRPTERAEAEFIVQSLEQTLGGHSFFSIDSGPLDGCGRVRAVVSPDFAVLYRTEAQVPALAEALRRSGMPFQHRSHRLLLEHPGVVAAIDALRESRTPGPVSERLETVCAGGARRDPADAGGVRAAEAGRRSRAETTWSGSWPISRRAPRPTPGTLAPTASRS